MKKIIENTCLHLSEDGVLSTNDWVFETLHQCRVDLVSYYERFLFRNELINDEEVPPFRNPTRGGNQMVENTLF